MMLYLYISISKTFGAFYYNLYIFVYFITRHMFMQIFRPHQLLSSAFV